MQFRKTPPTSPSQDSRSPLPIPLFLSLDSSAKTREWIKQKGQITVWYWGILSSFSSYRYCVEMGSVLEGVFPYRALGEESSSSSSNPTDAVIFVGICLVLGIACRQLLRGTRVPYTVALLILGIALGSLGSCLILLFFLIPFVLGLNMWFLFIFLF